METNHIFRLHIILIIYDFMSFHFFKRKCEFCMYVHFNTIKRCNQNMIYVVVLSFYLITNYGDYDDKKKKEWKKVVNWKIWVKQSIFCLLWHNQKECKVLRKKNLSLFPNFAYSRKMTLILNLLPNCYSEHIELCKVFQLEIS